MTLCLGTLDRKPTIDERHPCGTPKTTQLLSRELLVFEEKLEVIMSTMQSNRRFGLAGTLILSALSLGALTLSLSPANAQCLGVDLGIGCAGLGVGSWYTSHPYYYGYPYAYGPPYYYGQPYYGYPAYSYPADPHDYGHE
jgi:hypothetical protein